MTERTPLQMTATLVTTKQPVITTEAIDSSRTALSYYFEIEAELPKTGAKTIIRTLPTKLTRDQAKRAWEQLDEALDRMNVVRLASPKIALYSADGQLLRNTDLWEKLDRSGYLAKESRPGEETSPVQHWFLHIVKDYGRKRTL